MTGRGAAERVVIALDGRSGAGKTDLAERLAAAVRRRGTAVVTAHLDQAYPGWSGLEAGVDRTARQVIAPFAAGAATLRLPRWDWVTGTDAPEQTVPVPAGPVVLLVEGVGAGARRCRTAAGGLPWLLVLLEAPAPVRRRRVLARDGAGSAAHWSMWAEQEQRHLDRERTRARADLVWSTRTEVVGWAGEQRG